MSTIKAKNGREFSMRRDMIDVTSMHRPDTSWSYPDGHGHLHCWHAEGRRILDGDYFPVVTYTLPTLKWIVDGTSHYPDGTPYDYGHHECAQCGEKVEPRYTDDVYQQFVPGMAHYLVDGRHVDKDEFFRLAKEAFPDADWSKVE